MALLIPDFPPCLPYNMTKKTLEKIKVGICSWRNLAGFDDFQKVRRDWLSQRPLFGSLSLLGIGKKGYAGCARMTSWVAPRSKREASEGSLALVIVILMQGIGVDEN